MDYSDLPAGNAGDLPAALNHLLFADSSLVAAQALVAMLVMIAVAAILAMSDKNIPPMGYLIIEGGVVVCLCLIGWLHVWILLFIAMIVLLVLATRWARDTTGQGGS